MADVITRLKVESSEYDSKIKRAAQSLNEMSHAAEKEGNKIALANKENLALVQSLGKMQTVATSARGKMGEFSQAIESATLMYNRLSAAEKQGQFGRALNASITQLQGRLKGLQGEMAAVQGKMGGLGKGGGLGAGIMQGVGSAFSMLGPAAIAAGGVTAAIGGMKKVIGDMVQINMQFEQSSSNLAAVMGKSRDEITALTDQAKQLGATTQYTANQILELQANLARLGFNENEILNSTKAVQAMATAMGADLGEAANLAGSALRGFGLNATEMERVASVLSVGTTKSALSFEKLATALPIVQTAAAKTGFTIEDTVAMLGKLTDNGINAASAATQLRKILNDSTTAGTKLANALGGPVKSFDELVVALDKANKAGQNHADSVALVNSKNATALDILRDMAAQRTVEIDGVQKQTSALQDLRDSITDCSDGMKAMQDEQLNTLQGSVTILGSAWEGLMLTFSESNGVLKKVTDGLTNLLSAWTQWRKRNQGGDAAIGTYELEADTQAANKFIDEEKASGKTTDQIVADAEERKKALEEEEQELRRIYDLWLKRRELVKSGKSGLANGEEFAELKQLGLTGEMKTGDALAKQLGDIRTKINQEGFIIGALSPAQPGMMSAAESEDVEIEDKSKGRLALLKAQYEEQEKLQIASLDRQAMNEAEYEAEVYKIKRETLQKIADLYQEETKEKAQANAAISALDIQYQGTQMRLANKGTNKGKTYETQTGPSGYSQEGISALRSEIQSGMKSMQMGSSEYMFEAERLVDLSTFENLLKTAVQAGVEIDPTLLEANFEKIDLGVDVSQEEWQTLVDSINEKLTELELPPIELDVNTGSVKAASEAAVTNAKDTASAWQNAVAAVNNVGSALQQIEDPAAKVSGIVMQAVANIALGFAQAAASPATGAAGVFGWIAAATAGLATMVATIETIKSATTFASGGMVEGTSYSGDNIVARLNAGEGVLTAQGVQNAAAMADGIAPQQTVNVQGMISGSNIILAVKNRQNEIGIGTAGQIGGW